MDELFGRAKKKGIKRWIAEIGYAIKRRIFKIADIYKDRPDTSNLEFVILAAGKSTRNYPHSKGLPHKSLVPFGSRKVIDEIMRQIIDAGGKHITIVVSSQATIDAFDACFKLEPEIEAKFIKKGDSTGLKLLKSLYIPEDVEVKYVIQENPSGTGHAAALAYKGIKNTGRNIVMIWPDDILLSDRYAKYAEDRVGLFRRAITRYVAAGGRGNMVITRQVPDPTRWGIVDEGYYIEKPKSPKSNDAGVGFFIFDKKVCDELLKEAERFDKGEEVPGLVGGELTFIPALNRIIDKDPDMMKIRAVKILPSDIYLDCGSIEGYEKALIYTLISESEFARNNFKFTRKLLPRLEKNMKAAEG
ncbi:MAG: sugar phosphate nucleotidyltransferase [Alphaproteobacteria bacterium]|nr:sugar phosphate nucleotidyltransferase [Alphaproteobacteria bacterium]